MMVGGRFNFPSEALRYSANRLNDILKMSAAEHYRLSSTVNAQDHTVNLMGTTAADLKLNCIFTPEKDKNTHREVARQALNWQYDLNDPTAPLWRCDFVGPAEMSGDGFPRPSNFKAGDSTPECAIYFSFNHCLGDGLSMLALARTFMRLCVVENLNKSVIDLSQIPLQSKPPSLLDNLMNPGLLDVIAPAASLITHQLRHQNRFQKFKRVFDDSLVVMDSSSPVSPNSPGSPASPEINSPDLSAIIKVHPELSTGTTSLRTIMVRGDDSSNFRKACKVNKTSISSTLIVLGLATVRHTFSSKAEEKKLKLPRHQGWIVTSSMRPLLPESKLLDGADKQTDPSLMIFGGYGASISNPKLKVIDSSDFWNRCRKVNKGIKGGFFPSMRRMKLMNWTFRRPKIWNFLQKRANLKKMTRTYSIELANIGAWDSPWANDESPLTDDRLRSTWFSGSINNSFDGARALVTLGVVCCGNDLSITFCYNESTFSPKEMDEFVENFKYALYKITKFQGKLVTSDLKQS